MGIIVFCVAAVIGLIIATGVFFYRTERTWKGIEHMIESAKTGDFSETDYDEGRFSRLESQMFQYLSYGQTARAQVEEEREKIKILVSDISHQTKTPIANMLLYTQLLEENESLDENAGHLVLQIEEQTKKLNFLIQSLIKTSRLESGMLEVWPEYRGIDDLLCKLDYSMAAKQKGISFFIEEAPGVAACFDLKWTLEALSNIVDNAIKYTQEGGAVTVTAKDYEMFARVDIEDTGIGMEEGETAKIFARFYRSPAVSGEAGVGIGLYLAREILSREGGYIKVDSCLGKGSRFSVFLPKRFIPVSNEPSGCLQTFGDCREGQIPRCSAALQV